MNTPINPLTQQPADAVTLEGLVKLANEVIALEAEIAILEAQQQQKQTKLTELVMRKLPEAMAELGMQTFMLDNGAGIEIKPFYSCSLPDPKKDLPGREKALKWLRVNGFGGLIKHEVYVQLGDDAVKMLASLRGFLNKKQVPYTDGQGVHAGTLKAFMKEQIEGGKPFPMDIFKGFQGKKAKIEIPKQAT